MTSNKSAKMNAVDKKICFDLITQHLDCIEAYNGTESIDSDSSSPSPMSELSFKGQGIWHPFFSSQSSCPFILFLLSPLNLPTPP